jgi:hypothetical protein
MYSVNWQLQFHDQQGFPLLRPFFMLLGLSAGSDITTIQHSTTNMPISDDEDDGWYTLEVWDIEFCCPVYLDENIIINVIQQWRPGLVLGQLKVIPVSLCAASA